jgi:transposase-like protein
MGRSDRRKWTAERKQRIVEETRAPGASVSVVARRYDINANLLLKWNRHEEAGGLVAPRPEITRVRANRRGGPGGRSPTSAAHRLQRPLRARGSRRRRSARRGRMLGHTAGESCSRSTTPPVPLLRREALERVAALFKIEVARSTVSSPSGATPCGRNGRSRCSPT